MYFSIKYIEQKTLLLFHLLNISYTTINCKQFINSICYFNFYNFVSFLADFIFFFLSPVLWIPTIKINIIMIIEFIFAGFKRSVMK